MREYVLDANALLAFVEAGGGFERVKRLISEAASGHVSLLISVLNWGEVFYYLWQRRGEQTARDTTARLSRFPLQIIDVDLAQALKAGEIKAVHKVPYVDCVGAALAETRGATLVTSDRHFEKLGRRIPILWIAHS
jgi:predicted nucleic acid-binding protein